MQIFLRKLMIQNLPCNDAHQCGWILVQNIDTAPTFEMHHWFIGIGFIGNAPEDEICLLANGCQLGNRDASSILIPVLGRPCLDLAPAKVGGDVSKTISAFGASIDGGIETVISQPCKCRKLPKTPDEVRIEEVVIVTWCVAIACKGDVSQLLGQLLVRW